MVLIPFVAILIIALFYYDIEPFSKLLLAKKILHAILISAGLWLGCMQIVTLLWHKFPWEKNPVKHVVYESLLILIYTNLFSYTLYWIEIKLKFLEPVLDLYTEIIITNLITLFITLLHEAIAFYRQWKLHFSKSIKLEKDNIEAKYETLKSQINPHFLFNSLNSLTTLVEDNEKAVDYIQNLSEFLRYILKTRDRELVLVRDEISILEKYTSLQKSRFKENLQIHVEVKEECYHYSIPPLVLQMLVENCIKHNIISKEKPLHISITNDTSWIHIENNLQKKNDPNSTGNGLRNITERYKFFSSNEVTISETNCTFKVSIPLLLVEI